MSRFREADLSRIRSRPVETRPSKVRVEDFARPVTAEAAAILDFLPDILAGRSLREAVAATAAAGHPNGPYVNLVSGSDPVEGMIWDVSQPRYSSGYFPLRNRPSILIEMHAHKPFRDRVYANRAFMEELIKGLRVKGKGDNSGPASKISASEGNVNQSGQLTDSNAPVAEIAENQPTGPHPLKDWMDSLALAKPGQGNLERNEKTTLKFSKMVQGNIKPLNVDTSQSLFPLKGGGKVESQAPPVISQIVHAMNLSQKDGQYTLRIALKPPQLGNVDVALTVKGHQVQASFSVENPVTHGILTHQLPELRALLAHQGLTMREVSVQVGGGNPQGFRAFDRSSHKFSGNGERQGVVPGGASEISRNLSEEAQVNHKIGGILSHPLDHINVFA